MSTLYIRLPSHAAAIGVQPGTPLYCQFALVSNTGAIERDGVSALPDLSDTIKKAQDVVLLVAAGDVTLLRVKVPPLSAARLKAALPNLVEDQLMSDPEDSVVVAGDTRDGLRTVAVVQRTWLELLSKTLHALGARSVTALPAQLCLPHQPDAVTAAVAEHGTDIDVTVRLAEQAGIGLAIVADQPESAAFEVIQSLNAVVPQAPIALYVPATRIRDYQESLHIAPELESRITLHEDDWKRWAGGAGKVSIDLMSGLGAAAGPKLDWRPWRRPLALAAAVLLVNAIGLNVDWMRMKREAEVLRAGMTQSYRAAFPKDTVVVDPLAQARQKMAAAQRESGQIAPDDFLALTAALGQAWSSLGSGPAPIAGMEYRNGSLTVKVKPGSEVSAEQMSAALASQNASITQSGEGVWEIRRNR